MTEADGSSPLARGTHGDAGPPGPRDRFIPARAGNTRARAPRSAGAPVHPRSRGEHIPSSHRRPLVRGSSPLARGTRGGEPGGGEQRRFIPARAGNTGRRWWTRRWTSVHPRSRGEHSPAATTGPARLGSSPLARGTHGGHMAHRLPPRFIPARAGNTARRTAPSLVSTVHPRSRGEHTSEIRRRIQAAGSSPLARGTRSSRSPAPPPWRFIPARAGNTRPGSTPPASRTVHPRSRGEHASGRYRRPALSGSSPLARGTPEPARQGASRSWFIPARAGNTPRGS